MIFKIICEMKKIFFIGFMFILIVGCSQSSTNTRNPYVGYVSFSMTLNLNLPGYSSLNSNVNPILITDPNAGVNGVIVMKISDGDFRAWEANCPNQTPSSCSRMSISGLNAKCACDAKEYSIFTGIGNGEYPMIGYRVEALGNNSIRISN